MRGVAAKRARSRSSLFPITSGQTSGRVMQLAQAIDAWVDAHKASLSASTRRDIAAIRTVVVAIGLGGLPRMVPSIFGFQSSDPSRRKKHSQPRKPAQYLHSPNLLRAAKAF